MESEKTIVENESTRIEEDVNNNNVVEITKKETVKRVTKKKSSTGRRILTGLGMGAAFGATAFGSGIMLGKIEEEEVEAEDNADETNEADAQNVEDNTHEDVVAEIQPEASQEEAVSEMATEQADAVEETPAPTNDQGNLAGLVDDSVVVAHGVSDDMSFDEAFATARGEVGPGGVFEWNGGVYGTYTANEWNNMTAQEKGDYNSHFNWNNYPADDLVAEEPAVTEEPVILMAQGVSDDMSFDEAFATARGEVGPGGTFEWNGNLYGTYTANEWNNMTAEEKEAFGNLAANSIEPNPTPMEPTPNVEDVLIADVVEPEPIIEDEPEVEILGIAYDEESGYTIGGVMVDDQEVYLIDLDNDGIADVSAYDSNHDGEYTADEYMDITNEQISFSQFDNGEDMTDSYTDNNDFDFC